MSISRAAGSVTPANIIVIGDDGDNSLSGTAEADTINGRGGDDWLDGNGGDDRLNGGEGTDFAYFHGYYAESTISFNAQTGKYTVTDSVLGRNDTDVTSSVEYFQFWDGLIAAAPKTLGILVSAANNEAGDAMVGGAGGDSLFGSETAPIRMVGGGGNDLLYAYHPYSVAVFSGNAAEYSLGRDSLTGNYIVTDTVHGRDGSDTLNGTFASLEFADGSQSMPNDGVYYGTPGDDTLTGTLSTEYFWGGPGNDSLIGGGGSDRASYTGRYAEYVVTFDAGSGQYTITDRLGRDGIDTLTDIDVLMFIDASIPIATSAGGEVILGTDASDNLSGGTGDDSLYGGKYGDDSLTGGAGNDSLQGGTSANTTAIFSGYYAEYVISNDPSFGTYVITDKVSGRDGTDYLSSVDFLRFADITLPLTTSPGGQTLTGTGRADTLTGGSGYDSLNGAGGNDRLAGAGGNDVLLGAAGTDRLDGGAGDDWLNGGLGNDVLIGRGGSDTAVFQGKLAEYQIVHNAADNTYQVTDTIADRDGVDTVHSTEFLQFADGTHPIGATPTVGLLGVAPDSFDFCLA